MTKLQDMDPKRYGIELSTGGNILPAMAAYKTLPGHGRRDLLLLRHPEEPGERLARQPSIRSASTRRRISSPRAASPPRWRRSTAVEKAKSTDTEKLIAAMEGMEFDTPKGKMVFRKEDHQALQSMYHFKIKVDPAVAWAVRAGARAQDRGHAGSDQEQAVSVTSVLRHAPAGDGQCEADECGFERLCPAMTMVADSRA